MKFIVFMLLTACLLAGCGQAGPLYLPSKENMKKHKYDQFILYHNPNTDKKSQQ